MVGGEPPAGGWWLRATGQSGNNEVWPSGHFVPSYWTFIVLDTN